MSDQNNTNTPYNPTFADPAKVAAMRQAELNQQLADFEAKQAAHANELPAKAQAAERRASLIESWGKARTTGAAVTLGSPNEVRDAAIDAQTEYLGQATDDINRNLSDPALSAEDKAKLQRRLEYLRKAAAFYQNLKR